MAMMPETQRPLLTRARAQAIEWAKAPIRLTRDVARSIPYRGEGRLCPVCGKPSRKYRPFGIVPRDEAMCVRCGALERHRLVWLYFSRCTNLFNGVPKRMLHIAPERPLEGRLRQRVGTGYLTADLMHPRAMVKMDITDIQYPESTFDVIYCSHVLEHVPDDRKAMREFRRVLKPDGWAVLLVPITAPKTYEDPSITDPRERLKAFGQRDHVRRYGPDYADRLREAGFQVTVTVPTDLCDANDILRLGLGPAAGEIYTCRKA